MDFFRCGFYYFMLSTGLADTYRNEQFLSKADFIYDFQFLLHKANFNSHEKSKVKENLLLITLYYSLYVLSFLDSRINEI
jgi:hypothetical protein